MKIKFIELEYAGSSDKLYIRTDKIVSFRSAGTFDCKKCSYVSLGGDEGYFVKQLPSKIKTLINK